MKKKDYIIVLFSLLFINTNISLAQLFPNPATLSTGQGIPGNPDPLWTCSPWYTTPPTDPSIATYTPALINNNCAPGNWVNPASLPVPVNNGNWITGQESNCAQNKTSGYRFFRLELNLPADCNGFSVTQIGNYSLSFVGYVDNYISEVFLNNNPLGISGGSFTAGSQISFTINGPWQVGVNYIDVLVHNYPASNPNSNNPYGLLLVADANSLNGNDTDGDGVSDLFDECPCTPGNNSVGCVDNSTCDIALIRSTFANAGCQELDGCWDECSMYFLNPQYLSGSDAQAFAQNLGANLISIQSAAENACILSDLNRLGYGSGDVIWIGFNDEAVEGQFEWYDQSAIVYTNWAPGEPNNSGGNEDCVQIYPGGSNPGTWNDLNCNGYNSLSVIEVNLCPITNVTPPITMCQGSDTTIKVISTILGSSPYTYQWDNGSTQVSQTISPMQSTDYYVTTSDRYSCSTNDTIAVTVNTQPTVSIVGSTTICEGDNITLTASGTPTGGTYTWNNGAGTSATVSVSPSVTTTYVVNYAINGCDEIDSITIIVTPKATPSFTNPGPICQGDALILPTENTGIAGTWNPSVANNQVTTTYTFTPNTGVCANSGMMTVTVNPSVTPTFTQIPAACAGSMITLPTTSNNGISGTWYPAVNNQQTTTYTFTPNSSNTCVVTSQMTIQVNPLPDISAGINQTICNGNPITLTATGGTAYSWNNGVNGSSQNVSPNMTTTYVVIGSDANNCENIDSVTINVLDSIITMTADTIIGCSPLIVQFSSTSLSDATYNWNFGDGTSSTEINPEHIYHNDSCFTVSLTINSGQCTYSLIKTDMICVYPSPQASFVASSYFISDVMNQVSFNNLSLNATSYDWYFGDETGHSTVVHPTYVYAPEIIQNYNVMLIASNESGCVDTARALIEMNREIVFFIPNTFTPDGDQFNNVFLPIIANGLDYFDYEMMVFDRWGEVIFETHDMHVGWDGTYNLTGKICQDGTYVWKIVVRIAGTSEKIERSGHVLLLR